MAKQTTVYLPASLIPDMLLALETEPAVMTQSDQDNIDTWRSLAAHIRNSFSQQGPVESKNPISRLYRKLFAPRDVPVLIPSEDVPRIVRALETAPRINIGPKRRVETTLRRALADNIREDAKMQRNDRH